MSVAERDPVTGHQTTGHEWNGITELNTRVPRIVWVCISLTVIWSVLVWIFLPAWPLVTTYTGGILGLDQREEVQEDLAAANTARATWTDRIMALSADEILADDELMARVTGTAPRLFGDNCAGCHGQDAAGGPGFPSLVDEAWLWGGDTNTVMETLRVGINATHPDTRVAQMLAFGRDGILARDEVGTVIDYVRSLSNDAAEIPADQLATGKVIFEENCESCHGKNGKGLPELGAPNLTDSFWIYGGDASAMFQTIWYGRQGLMPTMEGRLTEAERKILTVYLQKLREEAAQ